MRGHFDRNGFNDAPSDRDTRCYGRAESQNTDEKKTGERPADLTAYYGMNSRSRSCGRSDSYAHRHVRTQI